MDISFQIREIPMSLLLDDRVRLFSALQEIAKLSSKVAVSTLHFITKEKKKLLCCLAFAGGCHNHGNGFINNNGLNKAYFRLTSWPIHHRALPTYSI